MMFLLGLLLSFFKLTYSLRCTNNCSMIYSMSQPFVLPSNCTSILANRCSVKLVFWYDQRNYSVTFTGDSIPENNVIDNRHFVMIETAGTGFFSYDIYHVCKETDNCARHFVERKILQMIRPSYNITSIYFDLRQILYEKSARSKHLSCFDMNDAVRQCTIPGMSGSCQIIDDLIKHKSHRRVCLPSTQESASVNIYDSENFAMVTIKCNQMLCNGPLTTAGVKKILLRHNITNVHGRLPGSSAQILFASYLFTLTTFLLLYI